MNVTWSQSCLSTPHESISQIWRLIIGIRVVWLKGLRQSHTRTNGCRRRSNITNISDIARTYGSSNLCFAQVRAAYALERDAYMDLDDDCSNNYTHYYYYWRRHFGGSYAALDVDVDCEVVCALDTKPMGGAINLKTIRQTNNKSYLIAQQQQINAFCLPLCCWLNLRVVSIAS